MTVRIRPSAKAVVVEEGRVLVTRNQFPDVGEWHLLPGGGQQPGETIPDALRREVHEETGLVVEPVRLLWVRELIVALRDSHPFDADDHVLELMFESRVLGAGGDASHGDDHQVGHAWLTPGELGSVAFRPQALVAPLAEFVASGQPGPTYLGEVD